MTHNSPDPDQQSRSINIGGANAPLSSPKLMASSVDNSFNGRLIPSSSNISLLSLGNTTTIEDSDKPQPLSVCTVRLPHHPRHKYYPMSPASPSSPINNTNNNISRLSAQLKKTKLTNNNNNDNDPDSIDNSLSRKTSFDIPGSPNLEPATSPNKNNSRDTVPKNISYLSLSSYTSEYRPSYKRNNSFTNTPVSRSIMINNKGNESPILRPVQTPGNEVMMTPLALNKNSFVNKNSNNSKLEKEEE